MKTWIIATTILGLIIWQRKRLVFYLLEYPAINTDEVKINGKTWRSYVNGSHFSVGRPASELVDEELQKLLTDPEGLFKLYQQGNKGTSPGSLSALIVLEAIRLSEESSAFIDKPVF